MQNKLLIISLLSLTACMAPAKMEQLKNGAMRDGLAREWVLVKKPDLNEAGEAQYIQSAFLKAGSAEGAAEAIFNQLQNSIIA